MMDETRLFYSIPQAAKACGVSRATMWNWVKSGHIKALVTPGGHHRIAHDDLEAFIEQAGRTLSRETVPPAILIVDDEEQIRKSLHLRLTKKGYRVESASGGFDAGVKVLECRPDLVILDIMMPGVDGFEVCRTIRQNRALDHTRVLAFTGYDTPENKARILQAGADGYLPKSTDFKTLVSYIDRLLGSNRVE